MANGIHWEWRGFGFVDQEFLAAFEQYPQAYSSLSDNTTDEYIWFPGSTINVKIRSGGAQQGLKLKRFERSEGDIELWSEKPTELFEFKALDQRVLSGIAETIGIELAVFSDFTPSRETVLDALRKASPPPSVIKIVKRRQNRKNGKLLMEFAEILEVSASPGTVSDIIPRHSLGIESSIDLTKAVAAADDAAVMAARDDVDSTVSALQLRGRSLKAMNYLDAIRSWVTVQTASDGSER